MSTGTRANGNTTGRRLSVPIGTVYEITSGEGVRIRLTRYRGGHKGPVMLAHCIGVSSRMFTLDTIPVNLTEYLVDAGFDVWLLDYRFSIDLPGARDPADFDCVAQMDYPQAVEVVLKESGKPALHIIAHGIGSQILNMAILSGLQGVCSAVCSQVALHLHAPPLSRFKAALRLPGLMRMSGMRALTTSPSQPSIADRLLDSSLRLHPVRATERCDSTVCRRITGFYGSLYKHDQLNDATHDHLHHLFGAFNLRAFQHLTTNLNKGHLVRFDGSEGYMRALKKLAIPITFIHGLDNECLLPSSTRTSCDVLGNINNPSLYSWHGIAGYGHVDCIIGYQAAVDVYPLIRQHLETFG